MCGYLVYKHTAHYGQNAIYGTKDLGAVHIGDRGGPFHVENPWKRRSNNMGKLKIVVPAKVLNSPFIYYYYYFFFITI